MAQVFPVAAAAVQLVYVAAEMVGAMNGNGPHNLVEGIREDGDTLLYRKQKSSAPGFGTVSHEYQYIGDTRITAVEAIDNRNDGTGGDPEIISGGVGHKNVTVRVTSRHFRGFDHTVYVYGEKKKLTEKKKKRKKKCTLM